MLIRSLLCYVRIPNVQPIEVAAVHPQRMVCSIACSNLALGRLLLQHGNQTHQNDNRADCLGLLQTEKFRTYLEFLIDNLIHIL